MAGREGRRYMGGDGHSASPTPPIRRLAFPEKSHPQTARLGSGKTLREQCRYLSFFWPFSQFHWGAGVLYPYDQRAKW
jgi:hypothetical protein